ncbi:MAG: AarF/ABC1/UbiB kinase family protein [Sphingobacteriales bacterium]|nr:AarF/ABC1/UbiB kinase family protein [Sphingobacteriales bacterium]
MSLGQTLKNISRVREIIRILLKYGFENVVVNTPLRNFVSESRRLQWTHHERPVFDFSSWERIRMVFEELGPTYVKLGQVLSNRSDILPEALIAEFQKLQSHVPPFPADQARNIIESELGKKIEEVFADFQDVPIGSASIGQVHKARLRSGEAVVIKVQRPGIGSIVENDLSILNEIVTRGEAYFERFGITNVVALVAAFERTMQRELNYSIEARNMDNFRSYYASEKKLHVPLVYRDLSTAKILCIEFIKGCKITDTEQLKQWHLDTAKVAEHGMALYLSQIFEHGYFHADPHPGNVLVEPNGVICLIDYGMVGKLSKREKYALADIFIGIAQQDAVKVANSLRRLAYDDNVSDLRVLEKEVDEIVEDYALLNVQENNLAELALRLQKVIYKNKLQLPGSIFLILRALAILEGIGKQIHPYFNIYEFVKPYGIKLVLEQYSPENIKENLWSRVSQYDALLRRLPNDITDILRKTRKGELAFHIHHQGHQPILREVNRIVNRLILAMLAAAFVLAAALTYRSENSTQQGGIVSLMNHVMWSYLFLGIALVLFVWVLLTIMRSGWRTWDDE